MHDWLNRHVTRTWITSYPVAENAQVPLQLADLEGVAELRFHREVKAALLNTPIDHTGRRADLLAELLADVRPFDVMVGAEQAQQLAGLEALALVQSAQEQQRIICYKNFLVENNAGNSGQMSLLRNQKTQIEWAAEAEIPILITWCPAGASRLV